MSQNSNRFELLVLTIAHTPENECGGYSVPRSCLFGLLLLTSANSRENRWRLLCTWPPPVWLPAHLRKLHTKYVAGCSVPGAVCLASCSPAPTPEEKHGGCSIPGFCLFGLLLTSPKSREITWRLLCT